MKKNILLVSNYPSDVSYAWWLMELFWCLLTEEIVNRGGKAYLSYPSVSKIPAKIMESGVNVVELKVVQPSKELKQFIQKNYIEVVYFTDRGYFNLLYFFLRKWGVKTILVHDHTPGDRPPPGPIKGLLKALRNRMPFVTADAVLNVSGLIRQRSIDNGCVPAGRTFTVQNGIPPIALCSSIREKQRAELGADEHTTAVITTGRAHPYKRFDFVIQVADFLKTKHPTLDVQFYLVGDGPQFNELADLVDKRGLNSIVHLLGYRPNVRELLQAGDIGFHASLGEAFSLSIIEYMSANMPVFVPDIPTVCQAITHMEDGCIYPWNDPEAAVEMLKRVIQDRGLLKQMGAAARANASNKYSIEECSRQFLEVAGSLIFS
ncbi:MAG: glycosyltransferase family 4 protein [Desulfobacteraceae bacterium]|nr:glycosyltransferase family 4 protein [Desulfobacteraceae bacterium]